MSNRHEIVLAEIVAMTNMETGACYPGRRHLSEATGYTEGTIATTIKELVAAGYIVSTRKAPEPGARALAHYAVVKPTADELRAAVDAHIAAIRASNTRAKEPSEWWAKVKPVIHLRNPDVDPVLHVNDSKVNPAIHVNGTDVKPVLHVNEPENGLCSKADVNPVLPTVTSSYSFLPETPLLTANPEPKRRPSKATRIDPSWRIDDNRDWGLWTVEHFSVQPSAVRREAEKFRDFWLGKPGKDGTKLDWFATWRNWARRAFAGKERVSLSDAAPLVADAEEESEHQRQLEILRQARLQNGLN